MFRLIKLAMYGLLGWMIYELYQGMKQKSSTADGGASSQTLRRALNEDTGRMGLTSGGRGTPVETAEPNGISMRHTVGRGVVSR